MIWGHDNTIGGTAPGQAASSLSTRMAALKHSVRNAIRSNSIFSNKQVSGVAVPGIAFTDADQRQRSR